MLNANSVLPADALVVMLRESSSSAVQNTILGALANYRFEELSEEYQRYLASRLEEWAHSHQIQLYLAKRGQLFSVGSPRNFVHSIAH